MNKIYHITHVNNLPSIINDGGLWSDSLMLNESKRTASIGMSKIKQKRLSLPVKCYPHDCVGDYVPFYFCYRSVMLYMLYRSNHQDLDYHEGQEPIIHLEAELINAVKWAEGENRRWAFSLGNAGTYYTEFRNRLEQLDEVDWEAVANSDFRDPLVKEGKQAEFLVYEFFPWHLITRIGVKSSSTYSRVIRALMNSEYRPAVEVLPSWYY